jgi:nucleotide-binding universal stress UspA family protein
MKAQFKTIIVPTDFSDTAEMALHYALDLVQDGGTVVVCHVIDDIPLTYGYVGMSFPIEDFRTKVSQDAKRELEACIPAHDREVVVETQILHGSPPTETVKLARERTVDLIVMGTHGRSGLQHALLGSVAEKVIRKAPCPVLVVREHGVGYSHEAGEA